MRGWVYVISNQAMPGIVKIGYSMKDPNARAEELAHTGAPLPYSVDYEVLVHNPHSIEQAAHQALKDVRVSDNREWFRCSTSAAVSAIRTVVGPGALLENYIHPRDDGESETKMNSSGTQAGPTWTLSSSSGVLRHVKSGTQFQYGQYYADNSGHRPGFVIRDKEFSWVFRENILEIR